MKNLIIDKAKKDFNPQMVNINPSILENHVFDCSYTGSLFQYQEVPDESIYFNIVSFILGFNSINFQHWSISYDNFQSYSHDGNFGYFAIKEGFKDLRKEIKQDKVKLNNITEADIFSLFGDIPEIHSRLYILKESLDSSYLHKAFNIIQQDAAKGMIDVNTAFNVADVMPKSFSDPYLAKIQLALYEIADMFKLSYPDLKVDFTISASYQITKVLRSIGILIYGPELSMKVENKVLLPSGSSEELAIRAATILACEKICSFNSISMSSLYQLLWNQRKKFGNVKFHLTSTTSY